MSSGDQEETGGGRLLAGRYRVRGQLGRGGMGVVWRAVDEVLGREVALKELRTYLDAAGSELADLGVRMQREARAAARVRHPGVVAVHDVTEVDGRPLIVMELVDGPSLDDVLRDQGPLDPREAAAIGAKVMDALEAAHRAGVLHRDVKPGNILLDRSGRVVLTDFGIATMDDPGDGSATHLTRSGELVGSLDYLAPERAQGQDPGPASDVWALGATLYAAVEGASPFRRTSTWSTLNAIVVEPLPGPRRAGHHLTPVLQQLMAKDPQTRPDAGRARDLLEAVAAAPADVATAALRQPGPRPRETTVRSVPSLPPPGFGPAPTPANAQASTPVNAPPPTTLNAPPPDAPRKPGRTRVLLAVAAVIAVLGAASATVAALNESDGKGDRAASSGAATTGTPEADHSRGALDGTGKPSGQGHEKSREPDDGKVSEKPGPKPSAGRPIPSASSPAEPRPTKSGTTGGGGGGASPAPAPACHSVGGGKYNCTVWRTADSYTASGDRAGVLNAGTNYFYCQQNLGRRETYGQWTNVWWAKTDDDSGNTNVFVSDVYLKGGDNNAPLPGLPVC
ncbi:protein kinase [Streptomyces sp. NPDC058695]|uniref:serine/threonine-protein kinase n=1 Tax=Streptomyces sp. NPDC058695 TaxID=3346604 RepID=UPI003654230B